MCGSHPQSCWLKERCARSRGSRDWVVAHEKQVVIIRTLQQQLRAAGFEAMSRKRWWWWEQKGLIV